MPTLYIVATPIGNLEDITLRALRVLKEVDLILCEDTRVTKRLLDRYQISTKFATYNAQPSGVRESKVIEWLREGKNIALVSDAGTPAISDPGARLVATVRANCPETKIVPIPGPSALIAALSVSGVSGDEFLFLGFLPHKKGRATAIKEILESKRPVVFFESPHRVRKTLKLLGGKKVLVARELTKVFEEVANGEGATRVMPKGEFVIIADSC